MKAQVTILFFLLPFICFSQETIILKNGNKLNVKIINRDYKSVTFTIPPDSTVKTVSNDEISFIKMFGETESNIPPDDKKNNTGGAPDAHWRYLNTYQEIIPYYEKGFSDEIIAGDLFMKAGKNFMAASICGLGGVLFGVSALIIPYTTSDPKTMESAGYIVGGTAGLLGLISVIELISGGNKLRKGGIVLQHKRFQIAPGSVSFKID